jgi:hypothetical protein
VSAVVSLMYDELTTADTEDTEDAQRILKSGYYHAETFSIFGLQTPDS